MDPRPIGELSFQFTDGYSVHCIVFRAEAHEGIAIETEEAVPIWTALDAIPYDAMWADDREWLPLLIAGQPFRGRYLFDGEAMLSQQMEFLPQGALLP
ncbi:MAG: hypothetical protein NTZ46_04325 [Verrucomicrobia bacterium]|nr:hypothetical protein [Verrucomicrobiota bacterium]